MKYCTNCGCQIPANVQYCTNCGSYNGNGNGNVYGAPYAYQTGSNGFAVAGFVLSFFIPLLGLIFSIIGLNKSKYTNSGKGLSIAGIIISSLSFILAIIFIILIFVVGTGAYYYYS